MVAFLVRTTQGMLKYDRLSVTYTPCLSSYLLNFRPRAERCESSIVLRAGVASQGSPKVPQRLGICFSWPQPPHFEVSSTRWLSHTYQTSPSHLLLRSQLKSTCKVCTVTLDPHTSVSARSLSITPKQGEGSSAGEPRRAAPCLAPPRLLAASSASSLCLAEHLRARLLRTRHTLKDLFGWASASYAHHIMASGLSSVSSYDLSVCSPYPCHVCASLANDASPYPLHLSCICLSFDRLPAELALRG